MGLWAAHTHIYLKYTLKLQATCLHRKSNHIHKDKHSRSECNYNTNCTLFTPLIPINVSITFSTHVVTSGFKLKKKLLQAILSHTHNSKILVQANKHQFLLSYKYRSSFIILQFISQIFVLRSMTNAPRYVSNRTLHTDLHIPFVATEIGRLSLLCHQLPAGHHNVLITAMTTPSTIVRRLKGQCPIDLYHIPEEDLTCILYHPFLDPDGVSLMDDFSLHVTYS